jgi:hypothetical protein
MFAYLVYESTYGFTAVGLFDGYQDAINQLQECAQNAKDDEHFHVVKLPKNRKINEEDYFFDVASFGDGEVFINEDV